MVHSIPSLFLICLVISQVSHAELQRVLKFDSPSCWTPQCSTHPGTIPRLIPDPTNCRKAFLCTNGTALHFYCPKNLIFDASRQECVHRSGCERGADVFMSYTSCPEQNGMDIVSFPHPTDCNMYYVCAHGKAYKRQCPPKLHYNEELRVCDYPYRAKCKARYFTLKS